MIINLKTAKALGLHRLAPAARPRRRGHRMKRREFITLIGGAAAAWPLAARAQQGERCGDRRADRRCRRATENRPGSRRSWTGYSDWAGPMAATCGSTFAGVRAVRTAIARRGRIGWTCAGRYSGPCQFERGGAAAASRSAPIVFANVVDPVGAGFVASLAQPGGNATGFTAFEYGISGKWLELLKEIAPHMTRAAVLRDPALPPVSASSQRSSPWRRHPRWS